MFKKTNWPTNSELKDGYFKKYVKKSDLREERKKYTYCNNPVQPVL